VTRFSKTVLNPSSIAVEAVSAMLRRIVLGIEQPVVDIPSEKILNRIALFAQTRTPAVGFASFKRYLLKMMTLLIFKTGASL
jgi:hypothetical protein